MLQQVFDPYDKLLNVLQRVFEYQRQIPIENDSNFCFLIEFSKISFEELTNHPNNYTIQTLIEDNYIILKRITKSKTNFYICSLTYRHQSINELNEFQKIAIINLYLLIKSKGLKVHYLFNKTNQIEEITRELPQEKNLTIVTINQNQKSFNIFNDNNSFKTVNGLQLLKYILESKFQVEEKYKYFETLTTQYLQEHVDEFLEQLQINEQLKSLYNNIDVYSQFPRTDQNFKFAFSSMIHCLKEKFQNTQGNNKQIQMIKSIQQVIKRFGLALDRNLKQLQKEGYQSVLDFCNLFGIEYGKISFSFRLDVEKIDNIEKFFEILDLDSIDWERLQLQQIYDLVSYIKTYYDEETKFDIDCFLQKFQTPIKVKSTERCVFVFGLTKAGKSTITSIIENPDNIIMEIEDSQEVYKKINNNDSYSIRNGCFSNNQRKIEKIQFNNLIIFDCPGVNDTDEQFRISNIYNIYQQILNVQNPIFLIIINTSDESNFLQNLKETIKYFNILGNDLFIQKNLQFIFILTKINLIQTQGAQRTFIDKLYENQYKEIYTKNDFREYEQHFKKFFDSFSSKRVIFFPHARQNSQFDLQGFKDQIFQVINSALASQQQTQFFMSLNISQADQNLYNDLQVALNYRANLVINFILQKATNIILLEHNQRLNDKLTKVRNLIGLVCESQTKTIYKIIEIIEEWIYENYKVKTLDSMRFLQFEQAQRIFKFSFQEKIQQYLKQLRIIEQEIIKIESTERNKFAAKLTAILGITIGMFGLGTVGGITSLLLLNFFTQQNQHSIKICVSPFQIRVKLKTRGQSKQEKLKRKLKNKSNRKQIKLLLSKYFIIYFVLLKLSNLLLSLPFLKIPCVNIKQRNIQIMVQTVNLYYEAF